MKLRFFFLPFFISLTSYPQAFKAVDLYTDGYQRQEKIEKYINKELEKGIKNNEVLSSQKKIEHDTLIYFIKKTNDAFTAKFAFTLDTAIDWRYCNYQEYIFDCSPCSQVHLKYIINFYNFRPVNDSTYLSGPFYNTKMFVKYKNNSKDCMTLIFTTSDLSKKEFKEVYKGLKKK